MVRNIVALSDVCMKIASHYHQGCFFFPVFTQADVRYDCRAESSRRGGRWNRWRVKHLFLVLVVIIGYILYIVIL